MFGFVRILVLGSGVKKARLTLKNLFLLGNYQDVISEGLEQGTASLNDEDFSYVIGSLCFNGRKEEAERLFLDRKVSLPISQVVACQFFLGIAFCRHGGYQKARAYIASNLRHARNDPDQSFYALQGLGFYHYFCADFEKAKVNVEAALAIATAHNFIYGRTLASDLLGHTLIQLGQVRSGLSKLEIAENLAHRGGDGGLARSIRLSIISYRAQHGFDLKRATEILLDAYQKLDPQNTHAKANLLLEIANQQLLAGQMKAASLSLEDASKWIYQSQHRRLSFVLSLRLAELAYHSGQYASALHSVQSVRTLLDPKHDRVTLLMALGLELKLLVALGMEEPQASIRLQISNLTRITARAISKSIGSREEGKSVTGEDAIASLFLGIRNGNSKTALKKIIESGCFALFYEALKIDRRKKILALNLVQQDCAIFDQGEVFYSEERFPKQLFRLLSLLGEGEKTKAELVQKLWGYRYHPLQHDALIYQAISRLRLLLKEYGDWIEISEVGYRFRKGVEVIDFAETNVSPVMPISTFPDKIRKSLINLNERQTYILEMFQHKDFLGVAECTQKLKVSEMTLRRDFAELLRLNLVRRSGKARATRYRLHS